MYIYIYIYITQETARDCFSQYCGMLQDPVFLLDDKCPSIYTHINMRALVSVFSFVSPLVFFYVASHLNKIRSFSVKKVLGKSSRYITGQFLRLTPCDTALKKH